MDGTKVTCARIRDGVGVDHLRIAVTSGEYGHLARIEIPLEDVGKMLCGESYIPCSFTWSDALAQAQSEGAR